MSQSLKPWKPQKWAKYTGWNVEEGSKCDLEALEKKLQHLGGFFRWEVPAGSPNQMGPGFLAVMKFASGISHWKAISQSVSWEYVV
jgi:hypothetical protein